MLVASRLYTGYRVRWSDLSGWSFRLTHYILCGRGLGRATDTKFLPLTLRPVDAIPISVNIAALGFSRVEPDGFLPQIS